MVHLALRHIVPGGLSSAEREEQDKEILQERLRQVEEESTIWNDAWNEKRYLVKVRYRACKRKCLLPKAGATLG